MVWPSTPRTMHCPLRVTCTVPGQTGSESISLVGVGKYGPSNRKPMRLLAGVTMKVAE